MWSFTRFSRVNISIIALVSAMFIGVLGFMLIEDFSFIEAFYMTVITISTVGFSEVKPLSDPGRLFTAFLIMTSFGIFAYALGAMSKYLFNGEFRKYFKERTVSKTIGQLKDHVIICGYGRNGKRAVQEFLANRYDFVVIEINPESLDELKDRKDILNLEGDVRNDDILEKVQIQHARALISTLPDDADNLLTVLTARELNKNLLIISRATRDSSYKKLKIAGANNVIMPDTMGGAHMASLVIKPDVIEFFDQIITQSPDKPFLKEVLCSDLSEDKITHTFGELISIKKSGVTIIGAKTENGEYIINPSNDLNLNPSSKLFVLGTPDQIQALNT